MLLIGVQMVSALQVVVKTKCLNCKLTIKLAWFIVKIKIEKLNFYILDGGDNIFCVLNNEIMNFKVK